MLHPITLYDEISCCTIHEIFRSSTVQKNSDDVSEHLPGFLSLEFNFVLKFWSLNICLICVPMKIPSIILAPLILGNFCLKETNFSLYLSTAFTNILIKPSLICSESKQKFYFSPKTGCATFF